MIVLRGDTVLLKSGEQAEVVDIWGVARIWCKLKTNDGKISFAMTEQIESVAKRHSDKKRKGWGSTR